MGWKTVEIENGQTLSLFLDNLVIYTDEHKITIPINDIDVLLINNYRIKLTVQLLNALTKENVLTIICNNEYLPESIVVPIIGNYNTLKVLDTQLQWNHIYKSITWKEIIRHKIINQSEMCLNVIGDDECSSKLVELSNNLKEYDISNREGHASKIYWHSLFGIKFKRFDEDYPNALLNYGYTVLRGYITRSIIKKGLDPRISFFHKSFSNYFALASDLMEPFRVIVDYEVYKIIKTGETDFYRHKNQILNAFTKKIYVNNKKQYINNAIDMFIDTIVNQTQLAEIRMIYE